MEKYGKKTIIGTLFDLYNAGHTLDSTNSSVTKMFKKGAEFGYDFEKFKHKKV